MTKILVTGGAGFIGSHLVEELLSRGHSVTVLDNFSTGNRRNLSKVEQSGKSEYLTVVEGTIEDLDLVDEVTSRVDQVYHLAAYVGVLLGLRRPLDIARYNVLGSTNVLGAASKHSKRVLVVSSSEVYGINGIMSEDMICTSGRPAPRQVYASSKFMEEAIAMSLHAQDLLEPVIIRPFNVVGPRQVGWYGMVLPRFVTAALEETPLKVYGTGTQTRCFCHVRDYLDHQIALMEHPESVGEIFNVGLAREISIKNLARKVLEITGSPSPIVHVPYVEIYGKGFKDVMRRVPDMRKTYRYLGEPSEPTSIDTIIMDVVDHIKTFGGVGESDQEI